MASGVLADIRDSRMPSAQQELRGGILSLISVPVAIEKEVKSFGRITRVNSC
jgi:hypothetical protein